MDHVAADEIVASGMTVSDKIRALHAAGYPRAEIARRLNKRYQHVRNVLEADKLRTNPEPNIQSLAESERTFRHRAGPETGETPPEEGVEPRGDGVFRLTVREDGSVVLPSEVRSALGLGAVAMGRLEAGEFRLISATTAVRRIQERLRPYMKPGVSWVDELIADRRREAEQEASDD